MQQPIPLLFHDFDFIDVFYQLKDHQVAKVVEKRFDDAVAEQSKPTIQWFDQGVPLTIEAWTKQEAERKSHSTDQTDYVLLQIIHMSPLRLGGYEEAKQVVHEMVVVAWACRDNWSPYAPDETRFKAFRRSDQAFYMVLDQWVSASVLHACKKRHLCLLYTRSNYERLLVNSRKLSRRLEEESNAGMNIILGRTIDENKEQLRQHNRARELQGRIFDVVDVAYLRLGLPTGKLDLYGLSMISTDSLDGAKRPPKANPVSTD